MIAIAEVLSAPALATVDGVFLYSAEADVGAPKKRMRLLIIPAADGDFCPVKQGDKVLVGCAAGVAYMLRHFVPNIESNRDAGIDRMIYPPRDGLRVRIGARSGGNWQNLMLYDQAHADILSLKAKIDALASYLTGYSNEGGPVAPAATSTVNGAGTTIVGGKLASGAQGRLE